MSMIKNTIKDILFQFYKPLDTIFNRDRKNYDILIEKYLSSGVPLSLDYDFKYIKTQTLSFVKSMRVGNQTGVYKYSGSTTEPNIYSSIYACMIYSLYGEFKKISQKDRNDWANYLDSFQDESDGLFRDPSIKNDLYENQDWWGARHLAIQAITAYTQLSSKPKYKFHFLENFYNEKDLIEWLEKGNWKDGDFDNQIMNYGTLLQYSRDFMQDKFAGQALNTLKKWLLDNKLNKNTGLFWENDNLASPDELSRAVQFSYHLYPLFIYDNWTNPYQKQAIDHILQTQNKIGGYGVSLNSSACEDIDSIVLLIASSKQNYKSNEIKASLLKSLPWVLTNMNEDGGFVFKRNEPFLYGHKQMFSDSNESSMFATWFRTLCLAYLVKYLKLNNNFNIIKCPGLEFNIL